MKDLERVNKTEGTTTMYDVISRTLDSSLVFIQKVKK